MAFGAAELAAAASLVGASAVTPHDAVLSVVALVSSFGPVTALAALGSTLQGTLAAGDETAPLTKSIKISPVTLGKVATGKYSYEGVEFQLKAVVDAVQTHNGNDAMVGAWGQTYSQVG